MGMTGRVVCWRFAKTVLLALLVAVLAEVALAVPLVVVGALEAEVGSVAEDTEVDTAVVGATVAVMVVLLLQVATILLRLPLLRRTLSPTMPHLAVNGARSYTFAT